MHICRCVDVMMCINLTKSIYICLYMIANNCIKLQNPPTLAWRRGARQKTFWEARGRERSKTGTWGKKRNMKNRHMKREQEQEARTSSDKSKKPLQELKRQGQKAEEMPSKNRVVSTWARARFPGTTTLFLSPQIANSDYNSELSWWKPLYSNLQIADSELE